MLQCELSLTLTFISYKRYIFLKLNTTTILLQPPCFLIYIVEAWYTRSLKQVDRVKLLHQTPLRPAKSSVQRGLQFTEVVENCKVEIVDLRPQVRFSIKGIRLQRKSGLEGFNVQRKNMKRLQNKQTNFFLNLKQPAAFIFIFSKSLMKFSKTVYENNTNIIYCLENDNSTVMLFFVCLQVRAIQEESSRLQVGYAGDKRKEIIDQEQEVLDAWKKLQEMVNSRRLKLANASDLYRFFNMVRDLLLWMTDIVRQMNTQEKPRYDMEQIEMLYNLPVCILT